MTEDGPPTTPDRVNAKGLGGMREIAETIMRFTPATLALAVALTMVSSVGISQRPDAEIKPLSIQWKVKGDAALATGNTQQANDAYETALAIDPRNRAAFIALGDVARDQGLQGKAVRFYHSALELEPTDMTALAGTVNALVERGALANARETLSRMKTLCRGDCPQIAKLDTLIEGKATAQAALSAKDGAPGSDPQRLAQQP